MKIGLIDVGGGLRDIFGVGVFDYILDEDIFINYLVGISAGSGNVITYLSKQKGRNYKSYMHYSKRKEYMSFKNYIKNRNYVGLDYIYNKLSSDDGELPFDYDTFKKSKSDITIVATNALNGKAEYFSKKDITKGNYWVCEASSTLPIMNKPYIHNNVPYYDGSISDPIPIEKCIKNKCDKIIIILTRPIDFRKKDGKRKLLYKNIRKKYPEFTEVLEKRCKLYNDKLDLIIKEYVPKGNVLIIAPESTKGMKTLTKNYDILEKLYREGYEKGKEIKDFIKK